MDSNVELLSGCGIYCENKECDFIDLSVKITEVENWINKPCPKCGTVLLTQEQFDEQFNEDEISKGLDEALLEAGITDEMLKSIVIPQADIDEANAALEYIRNLEID